MKKNGFTLAELLGVIVILAAVALVAFPPIINQMRSSKTELDEALNTLILTATKQYLEEKALDQSGSYCIRLSVLTENGKLVEPITDSSGSTINVSSIFYVKFPESAGGEFQTSINDSVSGLNCGVEILS